MRRLPSLLLILLCAAVNGSEKIPSASEPAPARVTGAETVQVNVILIDLVVRDRKDRPVTGLTRADFELTVDHKPVDPADIESFEEICASPLPDQAARSEPFPPAGDTGAAAPATATLRHVVMFLDFSHLSFAAHRQTLQAARDYLARQLTPADRVMILAFKKELRLVQDFTSDGAALASHLQKMLDDPDTFDTDVLEEAQRMREVAAKPCLDAGGLSCAGRMGLATVYAAQDEARARRTLKTIEGLSPALASLPGRKALVLFTDVLREAPGIEYLAQAKSSPSSEGITISADLMRLTREANAAGVSIYTVHAAGLDDAGNERFRDAQQIISTDDAVSASFEGARSGLDSALAMQTTLAAETGGRALKRTNEISAILTSARQDLSCYYVLGYRHAARGDGAQHSLQVELLPDASGASRRGITVRHRPYYTDTSPADRMNRLVRSALEIPDLHRRIKVDAEAFALAPQQGLRRVLIKATVPIEALSLLPDGDSELKGQVRVAGEVFRKDGGQKPACSFRHDLPLQWRRDGTAPTRLIYETGCLLEPGAYDLALAVLDHATRELGAVRRPLMVPAAENPGSADAASAYVGEVHLWARDPGALIISAGADAIGLKDGAVSAAFVPQSERRLGPGQEALLSFYLCPATGSSPSRERPMRVSRTLVGEGDAEVADFRDLLISEPPDRETGCYQIVNSIPSGVLGDGLYRFTIRLRGPALPGPLVREAALAVN